MGQGQGMSDTHPVYVDTAQKANEAMRLRLAGHSLDQIAERLGYSHRGNVHRLISTAIADLRHEHADELRDLDLARLDQLMLAIWSQAMDGDLNAVDRALKIIERRAKMCGYEQPTVVAAQSTAETTGATMAVARRLGDVLGELSGDAEQQLGRTLHELLPAKHESGSDNETTTVTHDE